MSVASSVEKEETWDRITAVTANRQSGARKRRSSHIIEPRTPALRTLARCATVVTALLAIPVVGQTPTLSADSLTSDFAAMASLKALAVQGKGKIGVLLPETTASARYTSFDAPYLQKAFETAGLTRAQYIITNAQGSEATELTQARSAISQGATVLLVDPISSGVGGAIETYAKSHGVPVIDYDRLTLGGDRSYYVSFDNVAVGRLIGEGMNVCLSSWRDGKPQILVMRGAPTDNNATLFAQGYNGVLRASFDAGRHIAVACGTKPPGSGCFSLIWHRPGEQQCRGISSRSLHRNLLLGFARLLRLGQRHGEDPLLEGRLDFLPVNPFGHLEVALESTEVTFMKVIVFLLLFFIILLLALDREASIGELHLDVFLVNARQFGDDLVGFFGLRNVHGGCGDPRTLTAPERLNAEEGAARGQEPETAVEIVKEPVDLPA